MKNKLIDLNDHLFAQLERLSDEDLTPEQIERECVRTDAIVKVSGKIIDNANVVLRGAELVAEYGGKYEHLVPTMNGHKEITQQGKK